MHPYPSTEFFAKKNPPPPPPKYLTTLDFKEMEMNWRKDIHESDSYLCFHVHVLKKHGEHWLKYTVHKTQPVSSLSPS